MPKDEAFNREIVIGEYIYCALQTIVREMIRAFGKQNNEITISTYRAGIVILGLEICNINTEDDLAEWILDICGDIMIFFLIVSNCWRGSWADKADWQRKKPAYIKTTH